MGNLFPRRRFQFSLRTLFVLTTLLTLCFGFNSTSALRQRRATADIERLGGRVTYDYQATSGRFVADATPPGAAWLRWLLGRDWFDTVHGASLNHAGVTDSEAARALEHLPELRSLQLDLSAAGDATAATIAAMPRLKHLMMNGTKISDAGLPRLHGMGELRKLDLRNSQVTPQGVARLRTALPNCLIAGPHDSPLALMTEQERREMLPMPTTSATY